MEYCSRQDNKPQAHVRTPAQFLRWSWIVALAFLQLYLAHPLGLAALLPWEAKGRPVTPRQVRRVMPTILWQVGTPVRACQPRGKAPGRAKGFHPPPAPRYPIRRKTRKKQKKGKTAAVTQVLLTSVFHLTSSFLALSCNSVASFRSFCLNINFIKHASSVMDVSMSACPWHPLKNDAGQERSHSLRKSRELRESETSQ